ncbi:MAG: diphosphomevalonate decarboxylase [Pseudomonadota bacterium]
MTPRDQTNSAVTAIAHPNIALVKYWGKDDLTRNLPATGSVSITLDTLMTRTTVAIAPDGKDRFELEGREETAMAARTFRYLDAHLGADRPRLSITSENNFPTAAGLASSASGFAALVVAINALLDRHAAQSVMAQAAGAGSGSAARSLFGGFARLDKATSDTDDIRVQQLAPAAHFPLAVVVAVTAEGRKPIGSTEAMIQSRDTSPYYDRWVADQEGDLDTAENAILRQDFEALATVSEHSCLKMHAVMQTTQPSLLYWNAATIACMHEVSAMRRDGVGVFFTIDAGPQLKAVCLPADRDRVASALADVPGVKRLIHAGLGDGARVISGAADLD